MIIIIPICRWKNKNQRYYIKIPKCHLFCIKHFESILFYYNIQIILKNSFYDFEHLSLKNSKTKAIGTVLVINTKFLHTKLAFHNFKLLHFFYFNSFLN